MDRSLTLKTPIIFGTLAVLFLAAVLVASNIVFTRHYLLVSETEGIPSLGHAYWWLLAMVDVMIAGAIAIMVAFIFSNARQILLMRRQDSFVDGVTHELRSPLASVRLGLDTLQRPQVPTDVRDTLLRQMRDDVDRLQLFIDHILEAGRLQNRERAFELEPTDVREVVAQCVSQIHRRHDTRGRIDVDDSALHNPVIRTDPVALEIAVLNLLDNALKYSSKGAPVVVRLRNDKALVIRVEDDGVGLARPELKLVFNRFYRVARSRRIRGVGLGLFVSRGLIRQLGGDIQAHSDGLGEGATFEISLPQEAA